MAVSSALAGLTSLFEMGRGGPCRNSHPKIFFEFTKISVSKSNDNWKKETIFNVNKEIYFRLESLRVISIARL
jgi:hypothetical protein